MSGSTPPSLADAAPAPAPSGRTSWTAVVIFLVLYAVAYLDRQVITLLVDPIRADLGISDFQISLLQGAGFVLFFTICGLPIGWAVDRFPRRPIVFVGIVVWSLAAAAGGLARNFWQLLFARFAVGAGEASLAPSAYSMLSDLFPKERLAGAMAVYSTGAVIGGALSMMLGGVVVALAAASSVYHFPLIGDVRPWQLVFLMVGLPGLLFAGIVFLMPEPQRRGRIRAVAGDATRKTGNVFQFMRQRPAFYITHILGFSLFNLMAAGYVNWAPTFLMRKFELPVSTVGFTLGGMSMVCGIAGMLGSGYIVDYLFRRGVRDAHLRYYVFATLVCGVAGVGAMLAPTVAISLGCMAVVKTIIPFIAVAAAGLQITTPNEYRGQVSAIFLFVYNVVGYGLGPSIMAGISDFAIGGGGNLGLAIAITFAIFAPLSALTFTLGLKPMRQAVDAAEAWEHR